MNDYTIFTDGAYSSSRKQGGSAFIILRDGQKVLEWSQGWKNGTNNTAEILAILVAISTFKKPVKSITIYSDSMYLVGGMTLGWSTAVNSDLWEQLCDLKASLLDRVHFVHVNGHSGHFGNEVVDQLAVISSKNKIYDRSNSNTGN